MEKGRIIIPIVSVLALAGIIAVIVITTGKDKRFTLPDKNDIRGEIQNLGYKVSEFDLGKEEYKKIGINLDINELYLDKNNKNDPDTQYNILIAVYPDADMAYEGFNNYYSSAWYLQNESDLNGNIKMYEDDKKHKGYIFYDGISLNNEGFVSGYAFSQSAGDLFNQRDYNYLYGGIYCDNNRIVVITTTDKNNRYKIQDILEKYELPM